MISLFGRCVSDCFYQEGSFSRMDPFADPAFPSVTHWALKAASKAKPAPPHPNVDEDDVDDLTHAHSPHGPAFNGDVAALKSSSEDRGRRGSGDRTSGVSRAGSESEGVSRAGSPAVAAAVHAEVARGVQPLVAEEKAPSEGGINEEAAPSMWTLGGRIPSFVGKVCARRTL